MKFYFKLKIKIMKKIFSLQFYYLLFSLLVLSFYNVTAFAQDSSGSSSTTTTSTTSQTTTVQPWVWVVGGAVLLLIIIALVRGNSKGGGSAHTDKVTYTKTTSSGDNP